MIKINKILFPTDFSRCAEQALKHAVHFAEKYRSELHILYADTLFEGNPIEMFNISHMTNIRDGVDDFIREQLKNIVDHKSLENLNIVQTHKRGISAAAIILEYSQDNDIDLIVMGTHGRRGLGHLFLGSVAEEVVRLAKCPVFTIKENKEEKPIKEINNILVPIDFSERSSNSIQLAKEIAKLYSSNLQLLNVIEDTVPAAYSLVGKLSIYDLDPNVDEKMIDRLETTFIETHGPQVKHKNYIEGGHAAKEILKFANANNTDLIVIATHGLGGIEHLLIGSVTEKIIRMAPCPVFITKSFGKTILINSNKG